MVAILDSAHIKKENFVSTIHHVQLTNLRKLYLFVFQYGPILKLCPAVAAILDFRLTQQSNKHVVKDHSKQIGSFQRTIVK